MAQSLLHVPPSLGCCLPVPQHWHGCLPEAFLYLLPVPGPGCFISVLSCSSNTEPSYLQHEEPGAQGCSVETDDQIYLESNELPFFISAYLVMQIFKETISLTLHLFIYLLCKSNILKVLFCISTVLMFFTEMLLPTSITSQVAPL